jgi:hypothetical protein
MVARGLERTLQRKLRALGGRAALVNAGRGDHLEQRPPGRRIAGPHPGSPRIMALGVTPVDDRDTTLRRCGDCTIALLIRRAA